jgi:hypothetical protein
MEKSGQLQALATLVPRKVPSTHWTGVCVGPTAGLDAAGREQFCIAWNRTQAGPVAIPTPINTLYTIQFIS